MRPSLGKAMAGGLVGTALLTLMMRFLAPMMTGQRMDIAAKLGDMIGASHAVGLVMHFVNGSLIFALVYTYVLYRILPGAPWQKGLLSGVILWLGLQLVMLPVMGGGVFSSHIGGMKMVMAALIGHLVYGAALGGIAGAPATKQS